MSMSRKNYKEFAASFKIALRSYTPVKNEVDQVAVRAIREVAELIATDCKQDNINFDRERFMEECGF